MDSLKSMHLIDFAMQCINKITRLFGRGQNIPFLMSLSVLYRCIVWINSKGINLFLNHCYFKNMLIQVERFFPEIPLREKVILMSKMHAQTN